VAPTVIAALVPVDYLARKRAVATSSSPAGPATVRGAGGSRLDSPVPATRCGAAG